MEALAWALLALGAVTTVACAVRLARRDRGDAPGLARAVPRTAPALLASGLLPLPAILAAAMPAAAWGLWGVDTIAAALVYAVADTTRDTPGPQPPYRAGSGP
ncbi:hypothetical protein [Streptomyces sp. NBC_01546]|uniref:hypothetical protein n=1 Tax=Streptomyces sp. NBC_01546 TaxID=2975872 RepID=UPI0038658D8A